MNKIDFVVVVQLYREVYYIGQYKYTFLTNFCTVLVQTKSSTCPQRTSLSKLTTGSQLPLTLNLQLSISLQLTFN